MITVKDFLEKITNPDRIKIVKGEEVLFAGYKGALVHEGAADLSPDILEAEMVSFRIDPEIRAKDWKARGLMAPIEPEQAPDYKFSDLEMKLYYKICIWKAKNERCRLDHIIYFIVCGCGRGGCICDFNDHEYRRYLENEKRKRMWILRTMPGILRRKEEGM